MLRHGSRGGGFLGLFRRAPALRLCADFGRLPLAAASIDLVWSNMALHWAPDPLAVLREFQRVLAPGGLLMFSAPGPDTLAELRAAAGAARVHAFADMHDLGDLLLAAGFAEPVMDAERLTLVYPDAAALLADLRGSGQTSALSPASASPRRGLSGRGFRARLDERLRAATRDGGLPATIEAVYGHAWKPEARPDAPPAKRADGRAIVRFERRR
jgi:malonyl-CoA O-methyltransferase